MSDFSAWSAAAAGADFHVTVGYGRWLFGFIAYRDHTQVLLGEESEWFALPSWLTAVLFLALAVAEYLALRFLKKLLLGWRRRRAEHAPA